MTADLQAWPLRIFVGGQEWTTWARLREVGWSSYDRGISTKSGTLEIFRSWDNPESIDPRTNRSRWREGQMVSGQIQTPSGTWVPHPLLPLVILTEPKPPGRSRNSIEIDLGCRLAYLQSIPAPDEDKTELTFDETADYSDFCYRYLVAGQVPAAGIALSQWGVSLGGGWQKSGGGSWVQEAADLAEICGRQLYCDSQGLVRDRAIDLNAPPVFTITAGQEEEDFDDDQELAAPPAVVTVLASGREIPTSTPGGGSGLPERTCVYGPLAGLAPGLVGYGEVTCQRRYPVVTTNYPDGSFRERVRVEELQRGAVISPKMPPPLSSMRTARDVTEDKYYDSQKRLYKEVVEVEQPAVSVDPDETLNKTLPVLASRKTTVYGFGTGNEILSQSFVEEAAKRVIWDQETGAARWETKERVRESFSWFKAADGKWYSRHSLARAFAEIKPEGVSAGNAYQLAGDPRAAVTERSDPPRIQTWGGNSLAIDKQYKGIAEFEHPGGSTNRSFPKNLNLSAPAVSDDQCRAVAKITGALAWGRNQGFSVKLGLEKLLAIDYPLPVVEAIEPPVYDWLVAVPPPNKIHRILLDAWSVAHDTDRASVSGYGVWLGTGTVPGQQPPPPYLVPLSIGLGYAPPVLAFEVEEESPVTVFASIATPLSSCSSQDLANNVRKTMWFRPDAPGIYNLRISAAYGFAVSWGRWVAGDNGTGFVSNDSLEARQDLAGAQIWFNRSTLQVLPAPPDPGILTNPSKILQLVKWSQEPNSGNFNDSLICSWAGDVKEGKVRITADQTWKWFGVRAANPNNSDYFDGVFFTIDSAPSQSIGNAQQLVLRNF